MAPAIHVSTLGQLWSVLGVRGVHALVLLGAGAGRHVRRQEQQTGNGIKWLKPQSPFLHPLGVEESGVKRWRWNWERALDGKRWCFNLFVSIRIFLIEKRISCFKSISPVIVINKWSSFPYLSAQNGNRNLKGKAPSKLSFCSQLTGTPLVLLQ